MAIEQGIWKLGDVPEHRKATGLGDEGLLEEQIMQEVGILNADWLLIGRQVSTNNDKLIDLLVLDSNGSVIIIELKRDREEKGSGLAIEHRLCGVSPWQDHFALSWQAGFTTSRRGAMAGRRSILVMMTARRGSRICLRLGIRGRSNDSKGVRDC